MAWEVALLIRERQAQLDELQQVHVCPDGAVIEVACRPELADGAGDDARELGVHGDEAVVLDDLNLNGERGRGVRQMVMMGSGGVGALLSAATLYSPLPTG